MEIEMLVEGLDGFEVVSLKNFEDKNAGQTGHWNGRSVSTKRIESSALPSVTPLSSSEESTPKKLLCGAVGDYFDPNSKEAQQLDPSFKPFQPSKKPLDPSFKPITSA